MSETCTRCGHAADDHPGFLCQAEPSDGDKYEVDGECRCPGLIVGQLFRR